MNLILHYLASGANIFYIPETRIFITDIRHTMPAIRKPFFSSFLNIADSFLMTLRPNLVPRYEPKEKVKETKTNRLTKRAKKERMLLG